MILVSVCRHTQHNPHRGAQWASALEMLCSVVVPRSYDCGMRQGCAYLQVNVPHPRPPRVAWQVSNAKACESTSPSQWGTKGVSVSVGSWRCQLQCRHESRGDVQGQGRPPPINNDSTTEHLQIPFAAECLSGETNSLTIPARCCDMYRYEQPRAYDRSAGIGAMTTGLK